MSKKRKQEAKNSPAESEAPLADAEFIDVDDPLRIEEPAEQPPRAATRLSWLALLLSGIAALGVVAIVFRPAALPVPAVQDTTAIDDLGSNMRSTEEAIDQLQAELNDLASTDAATALSMENLQQQLTIKLASQLEAYDSLPDRMSNVEEALSAIQGISTGVRDNWLLAEAEYYMQIANAQLQLAGNPQLARLALLQADERIRKLANPALTQVRRILSGELRALDSMSRPDIEGMTLTLASLASVVESLPIRQQLELPLAIEDSVEGELSGIDRAIASLKSTVSDVVSVRRTDESVRPLIAPESAFFLRANLALQLQVARLALLRGEKIVFQQSLDDANTWLGEYYDTDSPQVQSVRQTILEIRDGLPDSALPDISESLRLLRQHITLSATPPELRVPEVIPPKS